jgi:hypothetical protein
MVWSGPRCWISKHRNSLEQQKSSVLEPNIVGIGYLLHMKTKDRIYFRKAVVLTNVLETVSCSPLCFPVIYSLATLSVISLRLPLVASYLLSTVGDAPHSAAILFGCYRSFPCGRGSKICFGFSGCAPELLLVLFGLRCFCVRLSSGSALKRFYWVYYGLWAFVSLCIKLMCAVAK